MRNKVCLWVFDKRSTIFLSPCSICYNIILVFLLDYVSLVSRYSNWNTSIVSYPHMKETYSKTNRWIHFQMTSIKENAYFRHFAVIYIFGAIAHNHTFGNLWILFLRHLIDSESLANTVTSMWNKFIIYFTIHLFRRKEAW